MSGFDVKITPAFHRLTPLPPLRLEDVNPKTKKALETLKKQSFTHLGEILKRHKTNVKIAIVFPFFRGDKGRFVEQQSLLRKLHELQALVDHDRRGKMGFTLYGIDDDTDREMQHLVQEQYALFSGNKNKLQLKMFRLEEALNQQQKTGEEIQLLSGSEWLPSGEKGSVKWGALVWGMHQALLTGADFVVMTDIDSNQRCYEIPNLVVPFVRDEACGAVVGSRFSHGSFTTTNFGVHNFIEFYLLNPFISSIVQSCLPNFPDIPDVYSGLKAFRANALRSVLTQMKTRKLAGDSELLLLLAQEGNKVEVVPRSEVEESPGASTIDPAKYHQFLEEFLRQCERHLRNFQRERITLEQQALAQAILEIDEKKVLELEASREVLAGPILGVISGKISLRNARKDPRVIRLFGLHSK